MKHGMSYSREYSSYASMVARCTNPKSKSYRIYGGRGITICSRWLESFENFYADMGNRPPGTTLDRKDSNGNYEPGNCKWSTPLEQGCNRSDNKPVEVNGIVYPTIAECCRAHNVPKSTFNNRLLRGWSEVEAATKPIGTNKGKPIVVAGESFKTVSDVLRKYGVRKKRFYEGLKKGLTPEEILGINPADLM